MMKLTSPTQQEKEILSSVKREMALPRRTASVRKAEEDEAEAAIKAPAAHPARA
ncbi:MAG: hypothetical protein ABR991_03925 [Terracidiphilus sp.]